MIPYWLLWSYFCLGLFLSRPRESEHADQQRLGIFAVVGLLGMTLMIGLRYDVGGDWEAYDRMFNWARHADIGRILLRDDPGYYLINGMAHMLGAGIWLVNLVCGALTVWGVAALARREPQPWLCILLAVPYLVVVVAMGYTRQAAALGLIMVGLAVLLRNGSILRYAFWVALAATFHKTAVIALPLVAFIGGQRRIVDLLLLASASLGLYVALLQDSVDLLVKNYIDARYESSGALIRIAMTLLPAVLFLAFRSRLGFSNAEKGLWRNFSLVAVASAVALATLPSSTAVDRTALYLLPIQFVVLGRIPGTLVSRGAGNLLLALYSGIVLFIWLNFAAHAQYWTPYRWWLGS